MTRASDPAVEVLRRLQHTARQLAGRVGWLGAGAAQDAFAQALGTAQAELRRRKSDIAAANALAVLEWVQASGSRTSLHTQRTRLSRLTTFIELVGRQAVDDALRTLPPAVLHPPLRGGPTGRAQYLAQVRLFYRYRLGAKKVPRALDRRGPRRQAKPKRVPTGQHLQEVLELLWAAPPQPAHDGRTQLSLAELMIDLIALAATFAMRIREVLTLRLCDIKPGRDSLTLAVLRKGGGRQTIELRVRDGWIHSSVVTKIRADLRIRYDEEPAGDAAQAPFFVGTVFGPGDAARGDGPAADLVRRRVAQLAADYGFEGTPHDWRRAAANAHRARGAPLIQIINLLGQTVVETSVRSYIRIYPNLQREQLERWLAQQKHLRL